LFLFLVVATYWRKKIFSMWVDLSIPGSAR
jgi:hypothetical protein